MLNCAHCHQPIIYADHLVYREFGDYIIDCARCGAHNVLAPLAVGNLRPPIPALEITGYLSIA